MAIYERLRVFVSSKMEELGPERQAIKTALNNLKVDGWVFEEDAGARPETIRQTFLEEVEAADLYVGVFWKGYGDSTAHERFFRFQDTGVNLESWNPLQRESGIPFGQKLEQR
jgi:hypothetical protein